MTVAEPVSTGNGHGDLVELNVRALRSLTATATKLDFGSAQDKKRYKKRSKGGWQDEAWRYYDECPEIWFGSNFVANCLRKVRLYAGIRPAPDEAPIPVEDSARSRMPEGTDEDAPVVLSPVEQEATDLVERMGNADGGIGGLMAGMGLNLSVPGECVLYVQEQPQGEHWSVRSTDELIVNRSGDWALRDDPTDKDGKPIGPNDSAYRLWRKHPRWSDLADSPMRPLLDTVEELLILSRAIRASGRSRLAGAGLLLWPAEATLSGPSPQTTPETAGQPVDPVLAELMQAMMAPIGDEGVAAAVVPLLLRLPGEQIDKVKHLLFERPIDPEMANQRQELRKRIATGLDIPAEVLLGLQDSNHWCVDDETEALTRRGWVSGREIRVGDEVLTLDHESGLSRWSPVNDLYRADVVDEPMIEIGMRGHSSLTTPNHRWPVLGSRLKGWRTTETLREGDRIFRAAPHEAPAVAKWSDALVEIVGWFWTEGSIGTSVSIAQSHTVNPERVDRIRAALTAEFGLDAFTEAIQRNESSHGDPVTVFRLRKWAGDVLTEVCPEKRVTLDFVSSLTQAQLGLFIDVSCQGDGWHYRSGRLDIWQRDGSMLDGFEYAGVLAGYAVTRTASCGGWCVNLDRKTTVRPVKAANASSRDLLSERSYSGMIWCPVTAESTWCARRRGTVYFTGNTAWMIDEMTFKAHLEPLVIQICSSLTSAYLLPSLEIAEEDETDLSVWYDPTALIGHPNRAQDTKDAFDRYGVSEDALRRYLGFSEEDAPSDEEIQERVARKSIERLGVLRAGEVIGETTGVSAQEEVTPGIPATGPEAGQAPAEEAAAVAAAAAPFRRTRMARLGWRLAHRDRELRTRLLSATDAAMFRAMERAGATLRRHASKDAAVKAMLAEVPNHEVAARLGPEAALALGVDTNAALDDSFDRLSMQFDREVKAQQEEARRLIEEYDPEDSIDMDALAQTQAEHRREAEGLLVAALTLLAIDRLFNPHPEAPAIGEHDENLLVPPGYLREAIAVAGGASAPAALDGSLDVASGGILTGDDVSAVWDKLGFGPVGYEWFVGAPERPFEPHQDLDGVQFESFEDDVLANGEDWPDNDFFYPGDHDGCQCDWAPVLGEG